MSAEDVSSGAAVAGQQQQELEQQHHQHQHHLGDADAGIPQLPGAPVSDGSMPQSGMTGQEGDHANATNYGAATASYQQQQQQQLSHGDPNPQGGGGGLTEEERTARKIFVGGLNRNTTADSLRDYFAAFGAIHHTEVLFDKLTGRSRGFGFVTFEDAESINNVVDRHHTIDESQVEVRRAIPREEARQTAPRRDRDFNENTGRVFIGGLGDEVTDDVLREFFSRFGELTSANVMVDRETNRPRGFGFVIYKNPDDAEKALGVHKDLGPNAEAKRAQPRTQGQRMRMMGMGGPGGAGGYRMEDPRYAMARTGGYGSAQGGPAQMYGGYNYAYHPYYAAYYAQVAAAYGGSGGYGGGYAQSPSDGGAGADRGGARMPSNRSTPY